MSVLGIDPSAVAPAFALWPSCETWQFDAPGRGAERLYAIRNQARDSLLDRPYELADLEAVFIERPTGRWPSLPLVNAAGVLQVAVLDALNVFFPHRPTVFELGVSEWKKWCGLPGNCGKPEVMEWARAQNGARDNLTQDEADALGIACAGARMLEQERATGKEAA